MGERRRALGAAAGRAAECAALPMGVVADGAMEKRIVTLQCTALWTSTQLHLSPRPPPCSPPWRVRASHCLPRAPHNTPPLLWRPPEETTARQFAMKRMTKGSAMQCPEHVYSEQQITRNMAHPFCLRQYASFQVGAWGVCVRGRSGDGRGGLHEARASGAEEGGAWWWGFGRVGVGDKALSKPHLSFLFDLMLGSASVDGRCRHVADSVLSRCHCFPPQDKFHLYFLFDLMPGGDLMDVLVAEAKVIKYPVEGAKGESGSKKKMWQVRGRRGGAAWGSTRGAPAQRAAAGDRARARRMVGLQGHSWRWMDLEMACQEPRAAQFQFMPALCGRKPGHSRRAASLPCRPGASSLQGMEESLAKFYVGSIVLALEYLHDQNLVRLAAGRRCEGGGARAVT